MIKLLGFQLYLYIHFLYLFPALPLLHFLLFSMTCRTTWKDVLNHTHFLIFLLQSPSFIGSFVAEITEVHITECKICTGLVFTKANDHIAQK